MKSIRVVRGVTYPEWACVTRDGRRIGHFGRTEEIGIIRWVAFDAQDRYLGSFGGRGSRGKALKAVIAGSQA